MSITPSPSFAQSLSTSSTLIPLSPAFTPTLVRGIRVYPDNPLKFDFIVDSGDTGLKGDDLKQESEKLIRYFLASLTLPEDELWVNLSPYEKDRIVPDTLGSTEMGRDMLAQDYLLKQITASLTNPDSDLGKEFWSKVYQKAYEQYGTTNIPVDTFNKVWIMPSKAEVYVKEDKAFIVESKLKVMLEEDYLSKEKNLKPSDASSQAKLASDIVREVFIPALEKEVNEGKNFSQLRQIYNCIILSYWYKTNLKQSILNKVYSNQHKVKGIDLSNKATTDKIYAQYLETFKKGVCNLMKVEYDPYAKKSMPRKYFAGGVTTGDIGKVFKENRSPKAISSVLSQIKTLATIVIITIGLSLFSQTSFAQASDSLTPQLQNPIPELKDEPLQIDLKKLQPSKELEKIFKKEEKDAKKKGIELKKAEPGKLRRLQHKKIFIFPDPRTPAAPMILADETEAGRGNADLADAASQELGDMTAELTQQLSAPKATSSILSVLRNKQTLNLLIGIFVFSSFLQSCDDGSKRSRERKNRRPQSEQQSSPEVMNEAIPTLLANLPDYEGIPSFQDVAELAKLYGWNEAVQRALTNIIENIKANKDFMDRFNQASMRERAQMLSDYIKIDMGIKYPQRRSSGKPGRDLELVLKDKKAVCQGFATLFFLLGNALGIPNEVYSVQISATGESDHVRNIIRGPGGAIVVDLATFNTDEAIISESFNFDEVFERITKSDGSVEYRMKEGKAPSFVTSGSWERDPNAYDVYQPWLAVDQWSLTGVGQDFFNKVQDDFNEAVQVFNQGNTAQAQQMFRDVIPLAKFLANFYKNLNPFYRLLFLTYEQNAKDFEEIASRATELSQGQVSQPATSPEQGAGEGGDQSTSNTQENRSGSITVSDINNRSRDIENTETQAKQFFDAGRWSDAVKKYEEALEKCRNLQKDIKDNASSLSRNIVGADQAIKDMVKNLDQNIKVFKENIKAAKHNAGISYLEQKRKQDQYRQKFAGKNANLAYKNANKRISSSAEKMNFKLTQDIVRRLLAEYRGYGNLGAQDIKFTHVLIKTEDPEKTLRIVVDQFLDPEYENDIYPFFAGRQFQIFLLEKEKAWVSGAIYNGQKIYEGLAPGVAQDDRALKDDPVDIAQPVINNIKEAFDRYWGKGVIQNPTIQDFYTEIICHFRLLTENKPSTIKENPYADLTLRIDRYQKKAPELILEETNNKTFKSLFPKLQEAAVLPSSKNRSISSMLDTIVQRLRNLDLRKIISRKKFALYSGPPGGGKGEIWDRFSARYKDIIDKFVLFHTRPIRPGETQDGNYYFRTPEHLEKLKAEGKIITTLVNNQPQGLALKTFEDTYVDPETGETRTVTVKGLEEVFAGDKVVVMEGGLGWFEELRKQYGDDLASVFISPFSDEEMNQMAKKAEFYIIAYETAKRIHKRESGLKQITNHKNFIERTQEAATQVQRRNEYSKVLVNTFQETPEAFAEHMEKLTDEFALEIFKNLVDQAEQSGKAISSDIVGGIDFNAENINVTTAGQAIHFALPQNLTPESLINAQGFIPVIINMSPAINYQNLLGLSAEESLPLS